MVNVIGVTNLPSLQQGSDRIVASRAQLLSWTNHLNVIFGVGDITVCRETQVLICTWQG